MEYDLASSLWSDPTPHHYFHHLALTQDIQSCANCVATGLSVLTTESPENIRPKINTQDPVSWSQYLQSKGLKLAYCPTDIRRLHYYVEELLRLDDLFTISTYTPLNPNRIAAYPDSNGWVCGSHFVILHRDRVYDSLHPKPIPLASYASSIRFVKRIFRVLPANHPRGL